MNDSNGDDLSDELWIVALGPTPEGDFAGYDAGEPATWPNADDGPHDGEFWLRYVDRHLRQNPTMEGAKTLRARMRQRLQTGGLKAAAVNPETGATYLVPSQKWLASGEAGRCLWWSGLYWSGPEAEDRCDLYLIDSERPAASAMGPPAELSPRERNTAAKIVYGLARVAYRDAVESHGILAEIVRDLEKVGLKVSPDTLGKWIKAGRDLYDPEADSTRKSSLGFPLA